jgi:chromosome segregation ATPase
MLDHLSTQVAAAQRNLATANECHAQALAKVDSIRQRITDAEHRQREITARRLEGESSPQEASEFAALGADVETLRAMLNAAEAAARAAEPTLARHNLANAEAELARAVAEAEFDALAERARQIEDALIAVVVDLDAAGRRIGHRTLQDSWRPTAALAAAIKLNSLGSLRK